MFPAVFELSIHSLNQCYLARLPRHLRAGVRSHAEAPEGSGRRPSWTSGSGWGQHGTGGEHPFPFGAKAAGASETRADEPSWPRFDLTAHGSRDGPHRAIGAIGCRCRRACSVSA